MKQKLYGSSSRAVVGAVLGTVAIAWLLLLMRRKTRPAKMAPVACKP
jgi:hypothetical protein